MRKNLFLCLIATGGIVLLFLSLLSSGWYDPNWQSRRAIRIDNTNNSSDLIGYQIGLNLLFEDNHHPDLDDVRFTKDNGIKPLPYWIEEYMPEGMSLAWVKIPCIPAQSTVVIYMYYNNPEAQSESDGYAVFDFFEDFSDGDISDWYPVVGNWLGTNYYLEQTLVANHMKIVSSNEFDAPDGIITEADMYYNSYYDYSGLHLFFSKDMNGNQGYKFGFAGLNVGGTRICLINYGVSNIVTDPGISAVTHKYQWIKNTVTYDGNGNYSLLLRAPNNTHVFISMNHTQFTPPFYLGAYVGAPIFIDNYRQRKYTYPEPTHRFGPEENYDGQSSKRTDSIDESSESEVKVDIVSPLFTQPVRIQFTLPQSALVSGTLYDRTGREIATFIHEKYMSQGKQTISIDRIEKVATGPYFIRFRIAYENGSVKYLGKKLLLSR
jgi:hypothetical protein